MRERLVGCLDKGGRYLQRSIPSQHYPSHRQLHSAFWSHGAGDIDLPSWWIALLQLPRAEDEAHTEGKGFGPKFLDFLYPSQTLAFIRRHATVEPAVLKRYQRIRQVHQGSRKFVSVATNENELLGTIAAAQARLIEQEEHIEHVAKEISLTDITRRETLSARLDDLLLHDEPDAKHLLLWQTYRELRKMSARLLPRQLVRMMRCLSRSRASIDEERLIELFLYIPLEERRSIHYSYSVSAAVRLDKLALAIRLHKEALVRLRGSVGTTVLLQYAVEKGFWQVAIEIWEGSYGEQGGSIEGFRLWDSASSPPLPEIWKRTSSALDYATGLESLAGGHAARTARDFALQLALQSLSIGDRKRSNRNEIGNDRSEHTGLSQSFGSEAVPIRNPAAQGHEEMINKAIHLQAPAKELYTAAISQVLLFRSRDFDTLALQYYRALRELAKTIPTRATVTNMLRRLCSIQSTEGIFMVLNDFRFYYGDVPSNLLEFVIPVLAHQGNIKAVEDLLQEYHSKVPRITKSHVANALLYVRNRRGEVQGLPEAFHDLRRQYNFEPDCRSWNTVIASYSRIGDVDNASRWFNNFLDSDVKPDKHTFIYMMSMFAKRGDLDAVKQLLRQSVEQSIITDIGMIDCLVLAQIHNGEVQSAENLVEEALNTIEDVPKSSRTRMWNYVLNAYALRADLDKVTSIHNRMRESGIPCNGITFAALMQCFAITQKHNAAYRVLTEIMPQANVSPTPLHYEILMSGYLSRKQYWMVFKLYSQMLEKDLKPTISTRNSLVRAATMRDQKERVQIDDSDDHSQYQRAQAALEQTLDDMNPMDLATTDPIKFVGKLRLDEAFTGSHFAYMVNIYGRSRAFEKATEMYDRYIEKRRNFDMNVETSPPINMLSALMIANRNAQDHGAVEKCWRLSLDKAEIIARGTSRRSIGSGWVLPASRYILNTHLRYYMNSLEAQQRFEEIDKCVEKLHHDGYALDSRSWNQYIVILLKNEQRFKAFELCEKQLMPGWKGWARLGRFGDKMGQNMQRRQSKHLTPHRRHPQYDTMVYLAASFVASQSKSRDQWGRTEIDRLAKVAPRTVRAVYSLPRVDDYLQGRLLKEV